MSIDLNKKYAITGQQLTELKTYIDSSGGDGIKTLTTEDYNWPTTGTATAIFPGLLERGKIYKLTAGVKILLKTQFAGQPEMSFVVAPVGGDAYLLSNGRGTGNQGYNGYLINVTFESASSWSMPNGAIIRISGNGNGPDDSFGLTGVVVASAIVDLLTSTDTQRALSANMGRELNTRIGDLSTLTTAAKTSTVAAINELVSAQTPLTDTEFNTLWENA